MKIGIDLYTIQPGVGGSGGGIWSYSYNMLLAFDKKLDEKVFGDDYIIFCITNSKNDLVFKNIRIISIPFISRSIIIRLFWVHLVLPIVCIFYRIDVLHKLASEVPYIPTTRIVVSILDLVREYAAKTLIHRNISVYRKLHDLYFKLITKHAIIHSKKILVISQKIKDDLVEAYHCDGDKVKVGYLGTQHSVDFIDRNSTIEVHKILYIAAFYPHKNHIAAVEALDKLLTDNPGYGKKVKLYFRGHKKNIEYFNEVMQRINRSQWKDNFVFVDYNLNDTLENIYDGTILLNLSKYEGFGLPIIEAQSFGLPVVCSDIEVFREIAGNTALFVNNTDSDNVAQQLLMLIKNKEEYKRFSTLGLKNSKNYTWDKMADIVLETYHQAGSKR